MMLAVSDQAASAIDQIVAANDLPDEGGVRLSREAGGDTGEPGIRLELVEAPMPGDESLDGAPVFLEPETAILLEDKLLDAEVAGAEISFSVRPQSS